jgi:DNA-damage-inducible protein J
MNKSTNLYIRVEPDVKESAEMILTQLGITMSNAVGMFLKQIILHHGLPFDITLPASRPLDISMLTEDEFHAELEKGYADIERGNVLPAKEAFASLRDELSI